VVVKPSRRCSVDGHLDSSHSPPLGFRSRGFLRSHVVLLVRMAGGGGSGGSLGKLLAGKNIAHIIDVHALSSLHLHAVWEIVMGGKIE